MSSFIVLPTRCAAAPSEKPSVWKEVARVREFGVARLQFRHGLAHALGIFDLKGDEAVAAMDIRVADQRVEGRKIAREFRVAAAGGMFEEELARGGSRNCA